MSLKPKDYWCARNPNHIWQQGRRAYRGCPLCRSEQNTLAARFPDVANEWHQSMNGVQTPYTVPAKSKNYAWWQCGKDLTHVFEARIRNRTVRRSGCLYCAGKRVNESNSLAVLRPDIASEWHPRLNKDLRADQVSCGSGRIAWWLCKRTGLHEWERSVGHRTSRNDGCPVCQRVSEGCSLQSRFPEIAAEWHPRNRYLFPTEDPESQVATDRIQKNRRIEPSDVTASSNEYIWWQCKLFVDHVWKERVSRRTSNGRGCPKCKELRFATENSLAANCRDAAEQWHSTANLPLIPFMVSSRSEKVVWWRCLSSAEHVWRASIRKIVAAHSHGHTGCPFCVERSAS